MVSRCLDKPPVVVYHTQESLKLFDCCWWLHSPDGFHLAREWLYAMSITEVAEELDGTFTQDAFLPVLGPFSPFFLVFSFLLSLELSLY